MSDPIQYNDKMERTLLGCAIVAANLVAPVVLSFARIPEGNLQLIAQCVGGFNAALGIIVAATWKTSMVERQQAATNQTLAAAVSAPVTTTTTTRVEKEPADEQQTGHSTARPDRTADRGNPGVPQPAAAPSRAGGSADDGGDAAAAAYGTGGTGPVLQRTAE